MRTPDDEAPATFGIVVRRYRAYALAVGLLTGLWGWRAIGDYVVGVGLFFGAILAGWSTESLPAT